MSVSARIGRDDVEVWVGDGEELRRVGTLRPSFTAGRTLASSSFEYDETFLVHGWQISPDLPLRPGRQYAAENTTLPGAFSDAAPDDWGQKLIRADNARRRARGEDLPARLGAFDFLLGVADHTRMGAVRFRTGPDGPWLSSDAGVANLHDLPRILDAAQRYENDEATDADLAYLNDVATSPGGARPKANVVTERGHLAIAKLPHSKDGRHDVERWEAVALTLAQGAGLLTPKWSLEAPDQGRAVLVSERFDRDGDRRLGYLSARSALELGEHDDGSRLTYEDFADALGQWSVNPARDLHELFGRIAFTVLVNNVDDHWRNHGLLYTAGGWRLAPMFDVNPSHQRGVIDSRAINPSDDPGNRQLSNLIVSAPVFGLRDEAARAKVVGVARAVSGWREAATSLGLSANECDEYQTAFESEQLSWALSL